MNRFHKLMMILIVLFLFLGGCETYTAIARQQNKRAVFCMQNIIDLMEVCIYEWSPFGCSAMIKEAGKQCMRTGKIKLTKEDLKLHCQETTINCSPPGEPG